MFFLVSFFAEVLGTIAGFGSSTILLPFALLFLDFPTALILVAFFHIFGNLGRVAFFHHGLYWRFLLWFGVPSVVLTLVGALLVDTIPQSLLKDILGVFLLLFAGVSFAKPQLQFSPTMTHALVGGSISGFFAGLIGTGGALRGSFLTAFSLPKHVYIATAAFIALAVDVTRIPVYLANGFLRPDFFWYLPVLFPIAIGGSYLGKRIVDHVPQRTFRAIVLAALAAIGAYFVFFS